MIKKLSSVASIVTFSLCSFAALNSIAEEQTAIFAGGCFGAPRVTLKNSMA